jgi:hypothetical protein
LYSARRQNPNAVSPAAGVCPRFSDGDFTGLNFAQNNFAAIETVYRPADVVDDTPTGEALLRVAGIDQAGAVTDPKGFAALNTKGPKVVILATDGEPALCSDLFNTGTVAARQKVVDAATALYGKQIKTYVVAVGSAVSEAHQQAVANAGVGQNVATGTAPIYRPSNANDLKTAFRNIILSARTCTFTLEGAVQAGTENFGKVTLDGLPLTKDDPNGWKLTNPKTLELVGTACNKILSEDDPKLSVRFPCGTYIPGTTPDAGSSSSSSSSSGVIIPN